MRAEVLDSSKACLEKILRVAMDLHARLAISFSLLDSQHQSEASSFLGGFRELQDVGLCDQGVAGVDATRAARVST